MLVCSLSQVKRNDSKYIVLLSNRLNLVSLEMKSSKKWPVFHLISDTWMSKVRVIHQKCIFGSRVSPDYLCVFCYFCYFVQNGYKCNAAVQTVLMCDGVLTLFETSAVQRSWMMRFAGCCEQENLIYKSK